MGQVCPGEKHMQAEVSVAYKDLDLAARPAQKARQKKVRSAQHRHPELANLSGQQRVPEVSMSIVVMGRDVSF